MLKLVILDFDDTLCQSELSCFNFENEIAGLMGYPPMSRSIHKITWGQNLKNAILERIPGIDNEEFMRIYEKNVSQAIEDGKFDFVPHENIAVLDRLLDEGKKLAIVTSRSAAEVNHMVDARYPLSSRINTIYHRDNSEHLKPDPRVFNKALYEFDVIPQDCIYVGDTLKDGFAAKQAGMEFIAVLESGLVTKEAFGNVNIYVDYFAPQFPDILSYILKH